MPRHGLRAGLLAPFALLAAACGEPRIAPEPMPAAGGAIGSRVDVFVRARDAASGAVIADVASVALLGPAGERVPLPLELGTLSSSEAAGGVRLAGGAVDPGGFDAIAIAFDGARLVQGGVTRELDLVEPEGAAPEDAVGGPRDDDEPLSIVVPTAVRVGARDAVSIFVDWDVARSLDGARFSPSLSAGTEHARPLLGLLYVADAATGAVLAVDRGDGTVVATGMSGPEPRALAASRDLRTLYVANAGDGSVSLFDTRRNSADAVLPIRLIARTNDVAVADDERVLVAANPGLDTVTFIDLRTRTRIDDVRVGRGAYRLAASQELRRVFVASTLADAVTAIDVDTRAVIAQIAVEAEPTYVAFDRRGRELYVGHRTGQDLLIVDAESLAVVDQAYVGGDVTAVLADRRKDRIYVARSNPPELVVIDRRVAAEIRRIPLSGAVEGLAQPLEGPLVYGASPGLGGVIEIDVVAGREARVLKVGTAPTDVVVLD